MNPETVGIIGIILLLVLILFRFPVGLSLFLVGFIGIGLINSWEVSFNQLASTAFNTVNNYSFSVMAMFILMGMFLSYSGMGQQLFQAANAWIGHIRGGLAMATIGATAIFSAISGSAMATIATMAKVAMPEMEKHGYKPEISTSSVAVGGSLDILIPPSVILILYGVLTGENIGSLLIAGLVPGILLAFVYMAVIYVRVWMNPSLAPRKPEKARWRERLSSLKTVWPFVAIFAISIGGIYYGVFTPNEAGGIGAMGAFLFALLSKRLKWKNLVGSLGEAVRMTCMIFWIVIGATIFGKFLAISRIPMNTVEFIAGLEWNRYVIFALIMVLLLILGAFLEGIAIMVLTLPILYPLVTELEFSGLWFGIIMVLALNMGLLTPPLGLSVFIISGVSKIPTETVFKGVLPILIVLIVFTVILTIFPEIATFLPSLARG
jgi:tripartite ATP-independent transporter DctM subunit